MQRFRRNMVLDFQPQNCEGVTFCHFFKPQSLEANEHKPVKGGSRKHGWARRGRRQTPVRGDPQIWGQLGAELPIMQSQHVGCPREAATWVRWLWAEADPEGAESWRCLRALSSAVSILLSWKGDLGGESSCLLL